MVVADAIDLPEVFGRYTLLSRIGYGGMAEVFLARTTSVAGFEKLLAVKRLLPHCVEDQQTVDLLADEARITVQLAHSNIVQVFDFGCVADFYYIAMEFVDGVDLKTLVQLEDDQSQRAPVDVALHIAISILDGLDFAHTCADPDGQPLGIIHRDVTPHNVLVSRHGEVKLTDFGVARARISSHVSIVGDIRGKFSYMPPEQACGGEIDHRVDIFAVGAILYELLVGHQTFRSASSGEQMVLLNSGVERPSAFVPTIDARLDEITLTALATDPAKRFESARAFADALREQLDKQLADQKSASQRLANLVERRFAEKRDTGSHQRMVSINEYDSTHGYSLIEADVRAAQGSISSVVDAPPEKPGGLAYAPTEIAFEPEVPPESVDLQAFGELADEDNDDATTRLTLEHRAERARRSYDHEIQREMQDEIGKVLDGNDTLLDQPRPAELAAYLDGGARMPTPMATPTYDAFARATSTRTGQLQSADQGDDVTGEEELLTAHPRAHLSTWIGLVAAAIVGLLLALLVAIW